MSEVEMKKFYKITCLFCNKMIEVPAKKKCDRYCSRKCGAIAANKARGKWSEETKAKIKAGLAKHYQKPDRFCEFCKTKLINPRKKTKFCSGSCSAKNKWQSPEYQEKISNHMKSAPHKGWKSRTKMSRSYAELFWTDRLTKAGLAFSPEHPCGKYFLDFYFPELNLDLEVDGRQHRERKELDDRRDKHIQSLGIQVIRFPWLGLKKNKQKTFEQVEQFLSQIYAG
jgi:very-short-patch-repair endonuclease